MRAEPCCVVRGYMNNDISNVSLALLRSALWGSMMEETFCSRE